MYPGFKDRMSTGWLRLAKDTALPLTEEVCAMMTSEINTTPSHDCAADTEPPNQRAEIRGHAPSVVMTKIKTFS